MCDLFYTILVCSSLSCATVNGPKRSLPSRPRQGLPGKLVRTARCRHPGHGEAEERGHASDPTAPRQPAPGPSNKLHTSIHSGLLHGLAQLVQSTQTFPSSACVLRASDACSLFKFADAGSVEFRESKVPFLKRARIAPCSLLRFVGLCRWNLMHLRVLFI